MNIIKKISLIMVFILSVGLLEGCSVGDSVELTEEQNELVSEYAAGLLLKYEKGHNIGLTRVAEVDFKELDVVPTPTPEPTPEPIEAPSEEEAALVDDISGSSLVNDEVDTKITPPLNEIFGMQGVNIDFTYAELCDVYPETEDLVFSMNASNGNNLLIMHFNVYNPNGESVSVISNKGDYKLRALVNGEDRLRAELTFLTNDLTSYTDNIEPSEAKDTVLVFELADNVSLESLGLLAVNGAEQFEYDFN